MSRQTACFTGGPCSLDPRPNTRSAEPPTAAPNNVHTPMYSETRLPKNQRASAVRKSASLTKAALRSSSTNACAPSGSCTTCETACSSVSGVQPGRLRDASLRMLAGAPVTVGAALPPPTEGPPPDVAVAACGFTSPPGCCGCISMMPFAATDARAPWPSKAQGGNGSVSVCMAPKPSGMRASPVTEAPPTRAAAGISTSTSLRYSPHAAACNSIYQRTEGAGRQHAPPLPTRRAS
mmetsp:Transcript_24245/g.56451  ORF Transcript_24245/g.56451 Transcript_24245/m.56451 type:complete len:236 (+) Transcript_24245:997-1704(+)